MCSLGTDPGSKRPQGSSTRNTSQGIGSFAKRDKDGWSDIAFGELAEMAGSGMRGEACCGRTCDSPHAEQVTAPVFTFQGSHDRGPEELTIRNTCTTACGPLPWLSFQQEVPARPDGLRQAHWGQPAVLGAALVPGLAADPHDAACLHPFQSRIRLAASTNVSASGRFLRPRLAINKPSHPSRALRQALGPEGPHRVNFQKALRLVNVSSSAELPSLRHACLMYLTSAELSLISPAAALVGVTLGIAGTAYFDRSRARRVATEAHERAITEVQTATVDLLSGVQAIRGAYQQQTRWRHYIQVAVLAMASIGSMMASGETLSWKLLDPQRMSPSLERLLAEDRVLDDRQRTTALDISTIVGPRVTRFYEAAGALTLGKDDTIADATRVLIRAVGALMEVMGGKETKYVAARERVSEALGSFREVVGQERRRRKGSRRQAHSSMSWSLPSLGRR
jgi:hypothetical protein